MSWRYQPKNDRTPRLHPVLGGLEWGDLSDNPLCATEPDLFVEVTEETEPDKTGKTKPASGEKTAAEKAPDAGEPAGASS